jgi:hypothetical protein
MSNFFSLASDPVTGKIMFFDAILRKSIKDGITKENSDSYAMIAFQFGYKEDTVNKYKYNPWTHKFTTVKFNAVDDSKVVEEFCNQLDFFTIIPELIVKPIIHPFEVKRNEVVEEDITNLNTWIKINNCYNDTGGNINVNIWKRIGVSVSNSVRTCISFSAERCLWNSLWGLISDNIGYSIGDSVWKSVWHSYYAYVSSFFRIKYDHDFTCLNELWNRGFVSSFDGTTWRLHSGEKAEVVYEVVK